MSRRMAVLQYLCCQNSSTNAGLLQLKRKLFMRNLSSLVHWRNDLLSTQGPRFYRTFSTYCLNHSDLLCRNSHNSRLLNEIRTSQQLSFTYIHDKKRILQYETSKRYLTLSPKGFVDSAPSVIKPYLQLIRFDRPAGTWLLFLPCAWSISLAAHAGSLPDPYYLALFALGSLLMRGAGCTINDMWDRDLDRQVARTRDRPLASRGIGNLQALTFLGLQLSCSLAVLLMFDLTTILLGASSMLLVIIYPLMKRFTYWPQAFLGLTLNWGAVVGWSAVHQGACAWSAVLPLYAAGFLWTMIYDTIYAHQDKEDDLLVGVRSTALKFGERTKLWLTGFGSVMTGCLALTGYMCDQTPVYYGGVAFVAAHLAKQIYTVNLDNPQDCFEKFRSNRNLGLGFLFAIILANFFKKPDEEWNSDSVNELNNNKTLH